MSSVADIPTSRIWNLDETGMSPQTWSTRKKVLAAKHMRGNVQESNDRTNVSALVCVNADGGFVLQRMNWGYSSVLSESAFLTTKLFIQYFEWFVQVIPPERPVLHFKRIVEDEKRTFRVKERRIVERSDVVAVMLRVR
ncbi:TRAF3-interacting protein [Phytophthora palmivora]|uniref:TRAF3-interacting protein n=1 Tax=Phytophthora palmivora TaxID=4796 RepID=A0A2P4YQ50_9STRA|nr:TRAF3-interacting protein [Phytophthora palmivora]